MSDEKRVEILNGSTSKTICASVLAALALLVFYSAAFAVQADHPTTTVGGNIPVASVDLSEKTDAELTQLTAQWNRLSAADRRTLLAEVRGRMAQSRVRKSSRRQYPNVLSVQPSQGKVKIIRIQRRYGRVVRKPDGSVVVQTRVVQSGARVTFGVGFEQRSRGIARRRVPTPVPGEVSASTVGQQNSATQKQ